MDKNRSNRITAYISFEDFPILLDMAEANYRDIWEQVAYILHCAAIEYRANCEDAEGHEPDENAV